MGRFRTWYQAATRKERKAGRDWYLAAECIVDRWAKLYGNDRVTVAGVIAALSQRSRWQQNLLQAERCLQGKMPRGLGQAVSKAVRIRNGEPPETVLGGPKIKNFYLAILGIQEAVVLDTWMLRAAGIEATGLTDRQYEKLADELTADAEEVCVPPAEFQATVWVVIRGGSE